MIFFGKFYRTSFYRILLMIQIENIFHLSTNYNSWSRNQLRYNRDLNCISVYIYDILLRSWSFLNSIPNLHLPSCRPICSYRANNRIALWFPWNIKKHMSATNLSVTTENNKAYFPINGKTYLPVLHASNDHFSPGWDPLSRKSLHEDGRVT